MTQVAARDMLRSHALNSSRVPHRPRRILAQLRHMPLLNPLLGYKAMIRK